ncbi:MAG: hypothetical protein KC636_23135, partial [Myxococcales bacterium]|nr:hypothetical protein [Myxococcales bacterium]
GNRGGPWRTGRNLLITMLLGGLWHGAAWHFVLWGAFHGALLLLARLLPAASYRWIPWPLRALVFFHVTCLGWALFRAETLADCGVVLAKLLDPRGWQFTWWIEQVQRSGEGGPLTLALATIAFVVLLQLVTRQDSPRLVALVWREPWVTRLYFVALLLAACVVLAPEAPPPFIYFQF